MLVNLIISAFFRELYLANLYNDFLGYKRKNYVEIKLLTTDFFFLYNEIMLINLYLEPLFRTGGR